MKTAAMVLEDFECNIKKLSINQLALIRQRYIDLGHKYKESPTILKLVCAHISACNKQLNELYNCIHNTDPRFKVLH